jgi:hypothetical protein
MVYQISVHYAVVGAAEPFFPAIEGWNIVRMVSGDTAVEEIVFEGASGVPHAMEILHAFLQGAAEGGLIKEGYEVKLFEERDDVTAAETSAGPTGSVGAATPATKRKSKWGGLF